MCGEQECAVIEEVEHDLGRRIARGDIQAGKGLVQNHRTARAQLGSGNLDATALPIPISAFARNGNAPSAQVHERGIVQVMWSVTLLRRRPSVIT